VDYVDVAVLRDVVERHGVTQVAALRSMVRHLLGNAGAAFSVEKFFQSLKSQGFAVGRDTVHELLAHLVDCFLVRTVWIESKSERQRMSNPRRVYPIDPGLIPVFDRTGRANTGHALETVVLLERHYGDWSVTSKSMVFEKLDSITMQFVVDLKAGETKKVTYTVETRW
jgi:predicted AAA+ superfamily ATPase